jgi:hypothetical protein
MFKKVTMGSMVLTLGLILGACGSNSTDTASGNANNEPQQEANAADQKEVSNKDENIPEPKKDEDGNVILDTVGQKVEDPDSGTAELLKIKEVNETVDISPIEVTVQDMKVIKISDLNPDFKEMMEFNTEETIDEDFTYLQINFTAENTKEMNVDWLDLQTIVLSNGQQIDSNYKDFIIDDGDSDYTFFGKVKKEFTTGVIVKDTNIDSVKLIFAASENSDEYEIITDKQQVEYKF